jgi:S1-C subfamily serine protease
MNRKYIATLALVAFFVIVIGLLIKPPDAVQLPMPAAEAVPLQRLSQEAGLRAEARYFADRIAAAGAQVLFVPELGVSGVRWDSAGRVVATLPGTPIATVHVPLSSDTAQVVPAAIQMERTQWVLAVGRRPDGRTVSAVGLYGGLAPVQCGDAAFQEIILDVPLHGALAGAGLFDLNGNRLGAVLRCGARLAAVPASDIDRALVELESLPGLLRRQFGLTVEKPDAQMRAHFRSDSGLFVREVEEGRAAARWGLRPGDILVSLNERAINDITDLQELIRLPDASHTIERVRGGRRTQLRIARLQAAPDNSMPRDNRTELATRESGVLIANLAAGTAAHRAGLRRGDVIIQVGSNPRPGLSEVRRALARGDSVPVFLVYQRASIQRGVLLSPAP